MNVPATQAEIAVRTLPAGRGVDWISEGFGLFKQDPGTWIGIMLVWLVISMALGMVNAQIVSTFLSPVFSAGLMLGCLSLSNNQGLRVGHLFDAFKGDRLGPLLLTSLIQIGLILLILVVTLCVVLVTMSGIWDGAHVNYDQINPLSLLLVLLVFLALILPLAMLAWFAPPLIVFRKLDAWPAMKLSLAGCLKNWIPFLLYGLVGLLVLLVAMIPLGLGLLVAFPVMAASVFTSYRDIYPEN